MRLPSYILIGLGLAMLTGYSVIGWRTHSGVIHEPFVMLPAGMVCLLSGLVGRFILPRL